MLGDLIMDTVKVIFNDQIEHVYPKGITYYEISKDYHTDNPVLGVKKNNQVVALSEKVKEDCTIEFFDVDDLIGNKMYKSALKFIFEVALYNFNKNLEVSFEHSVPKGMLGEVKGDYILNENDIDQIKSEMAKIIAADLPFERLNVRPEEAIKYYNKIGQTEKAENIQNINDRAISLYKLADHLNYFYSLMPYSTKVITTYDLIYLGDNQIIFLFPKVGDKGKILEYVKHPNILLSFAKGKAWLKSLRMPYVTDLNKTVANGTIKDFIRSSELIFSLNIARVAEAICAKEEIKFIMIAGPSSSGKTTTTGRLSAYLSALGYNPINISLDDYYIDRADLPKNEEGIQDFEALSAVDVAGFNRDITKLLNQEEVILPTYNFITGKREYNGHKTKIHDNTIFLIEGLHALNNELMPMVDKKYKYKIYLSPFIPINIDRHNYISTLDLRLLRRIVRDNRTRGYNVTETIDSWQRVRNGEEKYIFPFVNEADTIINTALAYEVGVLKVFVEPLLLAVSIDNKYYEEARRLINFLKQFYTIPGEYVNDDSILREFIGGKNND